MSKIPTIKCESVILRKIKPSDIEDRFAIGRQHEFIHMCGGETLPQTEYPKREVWVNWYERKKDAEYSWIIEYNKHCVGTAGFHNISAEDNSATYRIGIFDSNLHSKGIGFEVTKLLLEYGFNTCGWHRIDLKVLDYNLRGIKCYEKCGIKKDGVLRENALIEGKYYSDIVMSILDYEFNAPNKTTSETRSQTK